MSRWSLVFVLLVVVHLACTPAVSPVTSLPPATASSAPARAVGASPIATGPAGNDRYGLIVGSSVRSEADARTIAEVQLAPQSAAVSPDGRRIAYWQVLRGGGEARVLWLLDSAVLTQPRVILTLADSETAAVSTGGVSCGRATAVPY